LNKKILDIVKLVLFAGIGIFLLWFATRKFDFVELGNKLKSADYKWALFALIFALVSNVNRSIRWNMLLKPLGYNPRIINTFCAVLIGYFANLAVPRLGEVSRCAILNTYEKVPIDKSLGTVVTERIIDVITLFACLLLVLVFQFDKVSSITSKYIINPILGKLSILSDNKLILAVVLVIGSLLIFFALKMLRKSQFYIKLIKTLKGFAEGISSVTKLETPWLFLFHTVMMWVMYWMSAYITFFAFPFTASLGLGIGFVVMVFGAFGFAAPVQGGIGTYHIIISLTLLQYGISEIDGFSYATLGHATQSIAVILFGTASLILLPIINRKKVASNDTSSNFE
jgi:uncharacterized protein (TIRG00374 family)